MKIKIIRIKVQISMSDEPPKRTDNISWYRLDLHSNDTSGVSKSETS